MRFRFREKRMERVTTFGEVVGAIVKQLNWEDTYVVENIREEWYRIAGDIISTHSDPNRIFKGILFITVDHSVYANEISMMKDAILAKITDHLKISLIRDIKVEIKKSRWKNARANGNK